MVTQQGFAIDLDEVETCRRAIQDHAGQFGYFSGGFAENDVNLSLFGTLPAATELARLCQDLHLAATDQFNAAQLFLSAVGQGLHNVHRHTIHMEDSNIIALRALDRWWD